MVIKIILLIGVFNYYGVRSQICSSLCTFPFSYNGQIFTACTNVDFHTFWCGTVPIVTDDPATYTICGNDCPRIPDGGVSTLQPATSSEPCTTVDGDPCTFPFVFGDRIFFSCTNAEYDNTYWCATSVNAIGDLVTWGICGPSCVNT